MPLLLVALHDNSEQQRQQAISLLARWETMRTVSRPCTLALQKVTESGFIEDSLKEGPSCRE